MNNPNMPMQINISQLPTKPVIALQVLLEEPVICGRYHRSVLKKKYSLHMGGPFHFFLCLNLSFQIILHVLMAP